MKNGLNVLIKGSKLEPWEPHFLRIIDDQIKVKNRKLPLILWITEEDIPDERCNIEYHVSGKRIIIRRPKNLLSNVKPEFRKKFYAIVDALDVSDQLVTNKHSFRGGLFPKEVEPEIERKIHQILKQLGYLEDPQDAKSLKNNFTNALQKILKENFPELNPKSIYGIMNRGGRSPGKRTRTHVIEESKSAEKEDIERENKPNPKRSRNRGGFSFTTVIRPEDSRQGWIQIETNQIVVNLGHAVAKRMEKTREGKQYHLCRIISSELLKLASKSGKFSVDKALEIVDKIFALMEKQFQTKSRGYTILNFNGEQDLKRNEHGRFVSK